MATASQLQLRRNTAAGIASFTGAAGEVTPDMTNNRLVLHDGTTAGGHPQASEAYVAAAIDALPDGGGDMFKADNLSGLADTDTALANLGGTAVGKALFTAVDAAAARAVTGVDKIAPKGHLYGLTLSNNATDTTNDIDIAAGEAADEDGNLMVLSSAITKKLDGNWFPGANQGGIDTGAIADTTYHVWLIQRSDTGVVDVLFSASATSPTMPVNYDRKRRIGSIIRASGAIRLFRQYGDTFKLNTAIINSSTTSTVSAGALTLSVPTGIKVRPIIRISQRQNTVGNSVVLLGDADVGAGALMTVAQTLPAGDLATAVVDQFTTNTSAQLVYEMSIFSGSVDSSVVETRGWIDRL